MFVTADYSLVWALEPFNVILTCTKAWTPPPLAHYGPLQSIATSKRALRSVLNVSVCMCFTLRINYPYVFKNSLPNLNTQIFRLQ